MDDEEYIYSGSFCIGQLIDTGVSDWNQVNRGGRNHVVSRICIEKQRKGIISQLNAFFFLLQVTTTTIILVIYIYVCMYKGTRKWDEGRHTHTNGD